MAVWHNLTRIDIPAQGLAALVAVWTEKSIWASMPAVGILLPQAFWMADFLGGIVGRHLTGMTAYMFSDTIPLFTRGLSFSEKAVYGSVTSHTFVRRALPFGVSTLSVTMNSPAFS